MSQKNLAAFVGLILLAAAAIWVVTNEVRYVVPADTPEGEIGAEAPWWASLLFWQGTQERSIRVHYGLDLVGGSQVLLQAEQSDETPEDLTGMMEAARVVIENRVSGGLGVVEPLVQLGSNNRIIVELPEVDNPDQAISLLRETGRLEFVEALQLRLKEGERILTSMAVEQADAAGETIDKSLYDYPDHVFPTVMTGADLADASVSFDQSGGRSIAFTLTDSGRQIFSQYTSDHIGDILAITLDGVVISAPVIQSAITTRNGQITGNFTADEAESVAIKLKYGALPVPLKVVENRTIGPSLGAESIQRSIRAGTIGLIVVLAFMLIYYRVPGLTACLTLGLYAVLNFSLYKLLPVTLTVPAIIGFILSLGMAVDANILVFERMKEEMRAGRSASNAIEAGFERAWLSIRDGNLSTLITCLILFWFGSSFGATIVKGFAVTLGIGVMLNLFTAVPATRVLMRLVVGLFGDSLKENSPALIGVNLDQSSHQLPNWVRNAFHMVEKRRYYYIFSGAVIAVGLVGMGISIARFGTPLNLAIDYTGGSLWEISFAKDVSPLDIRQVFVDAGYAGTAVQRVGEGGTVLIRTSDLSVDEKVALADQLVQQFGTFEELRFESVGPTIGREVTHASGVAVGFASLAILLFIWYVFRAVPHAFRYGVGAIVALLHDVLVTAGVFAILGLVLGWEVNALFLTAILTVIGYSVNDTIVVFDRMRENLPRRRFDSFETVANRSLLETLTRSLGTALSTLFVIGAILFFGGATTQQFIAVMLVGIISGTYSSIFTAVPFVVSWQRGDFARATQRPAVTTG